jgi:hypothetical protein
MEIEKLDNISTVEVKSIDRGITSNKKDIEANIDELKERISFELLYTTTTQGLEGNLNTNNIMGTGISATAQINSLDSVFIGFSIPNQRSKVVYSFKLTVGLENISSDFFETTGLIDFLHNAMFEYRYPSADVASTELSKNLPENENLPRYSFGEFDSIKFGPRWKDDSRERSIKGMYLAFNSHCNIPLSNNDFLGLGLTLKNRSFEYPKNNFLVEKHTIQEPYFKGTSDQQESKRRFEELELKRRKAKIVRWEDLSDEDKVELYNSGSGSNLNIDQIKALPSYMQKRAATKGLIERISQGVPKNRFLDPILKEKFEFILSAEYKKMFVFEDLNSSSFDFFIKISSILGTTNALKLWLNFNSRINISHSWHLDLDFLLGIAANSHYLDNFKGSDIGLFASSGPTEMYNFTSLGGKFMTRATARINYKVHIDSPLVFYPNLAFTVTGLSNSGYEPKRMPANLLQKRGWPKDTIDIAQNKFCPIIIVSPGIKMRSGAFIFGVSANFKVHDENPECNRLRPVNIELGLKIGD